MLAECYTSYGCLDEKKAQHCVVVRKFKFSGKMEQQEFA